MNDAGQVSWFAQRTVGAPEALRQRAEHFLAATGDGDLGQRLALAGTAALTAAARDGADRSAALDLLAADALITLALLRTAEDDPANLEHAAAALRLQVTSSA
jgi:hypothetical protein